MPLINPARTAARSGPRGLALAESAPPPEVEVPAADPDAAAAGCWSFQARAREAMAALDVSVGEVIAVLEGPATLFRSRRERLMVATRGGLMVIHDRAGRCVHSVVRVAGLAA